MTVAAEAQRPLVLIVDDYDDTRAIVAELLLDDGFRVDEASTGPEALEKARALLPDVILMDLSIPGIDGWEVTRILRADPRTRGLAIITLTAHALQSHIERARQAGSDCVVTKPCEPAELIGTINTVLAARAPAAGEGRT